MDVELAALAKEKLLCRTNVELTTGCRTNIIPMGSSASRII